MGLFSNKKKPCPICGNPTPRLLPRKFDDQPICKECEKKVDLPGETADKMTLAEFRDYLMVYNDNESLRAMFSETYRYPFAFLKNETFLLDETNGLIRLRANEESWVLEKHYLKSFCIYEDDRVLFESGEGVLNIYSSDIPKRAKELEVIVSTFEMQKREYERREQLEEARAIRHETDEERRERERIEERYRPQFEDPQLLQKFRIELTLDHPYWHSYEHEVQGPSFDSWSPSVRAYLKSYQEKVDEWYLIATKLMHMIDANAGERRMDADAPETGAATGASTDVVAELKKYSELAEQGIITQEEFALKKKQLLGI